MELSVVKYFWKKLDLRFLTEFWMRLWIHCLESVRFQRFSGVYFLIFELNTEWYGVSLHNQSEYEKIQTRKFFNTDTFHAMILSLLPNAYSKSWKEISWQWLTCMIIEPLCPWESKRSCFPKQHKNFLNEIN